MESRLYTKYKKEILPALREEFGIKNIMRVPKIQKVVLNVGYGRHMKDKAFIENVEKTLSVISGQKPLHNKAKKSISNFKIREGNLVGASVTLRGKKMYDFLDKFVSITLPRVRDFQGLPTNSFDEGGNYTVGLKENIAFPEIRNDEVEKIHGLQVIVCTNTKDKKITRFFLEKIGFPFKIGK